MSGMRVLIGCEFSGVVRRAFRERGHDAWSCDLLPAEDGDIHHLQCDVRNAFCDLTRQPAWDMAILFPPCTHLAASGAKHFAKKIADGCQQQGIDFFMDMTRLPVQRWAIENPIGIMSSRYRPPDQVVHPFYFGDKVQKATCLWLRNLPPLIHAEEDELFWSKTHVDRGMIYVDPQGHKHGGEHTLRAKRAWSPLMLLAPSEERWKIRSRTFPGIARAMAEQWGGV